MLVWRKPLKDLYDKSLFESIVKINYRYLKTQKKRPTFKSWQLCKKNKYSDINRQLPVKKNTKSKIITYTEDNP